MAQPLQLVGGSLLLQLSPADVESPGKLYQALMMMLGNLNTWERKVAACVNTPAAGTTGERPTPAQLAALPNGGVGYMMYDTQIGRPIWWTGGAWETFVGQFNPA